MEEPVTSIWSVSSTGATNAYQTSNEADLGYLTEDYHVAVNSSQDYRNATVRPFLLPFHEKTIWQIVFSIMVTVAIAGNSIVMWIVLAHKQMRTVTNYFLFNLSLADFVMSVFNSTFNFVYMLDSHWPFGAVYCTVNNFIANVSVATSAFTIVAMSLDRYYAIVRPLTPRMGKFRAVTYIVIIWVGSCALSMPTLLYSATKTWTYDDGNYRTLCFLWWPDGVSTSSKMDHTYNVIFLMFTYVIPIIILLVSYKKMCFVLWWNTSIGECTSRQLQLLKCKRKVVRMFIIIVLLFSICWMPYQICFVYAYYNTELVHTSYIQNMYLGFYWLAMSNTMYNPIVYYWMNGRFRLYFRTAICCWKKVRTISLMKRSFRWSKTVGEPSTSSSRQKPTVVCSRNGNIKLVERNPCLETGSMTYKWSTAIEQRPFSEFDGATSNI